MLWKISCVPPHLRHSYSYVGISCPFFPSFPKNTLRVSTNKPLVYTFLRRLGVSAKKNIDKFQITDRRPPSLMQEGGLSRLHLISIFLRCAFASSVLGSVRLSTPFLKVALTLSLCKPLGSGNDRWNVP